MTYSPPPEVLERYAKLLIDYALGEGEGIKQGDVVRVIANEDARPLFIELCKAVWRSGGHVIQDYNVAEDSSSSLKRAFLEIASDEQLDFFPLEYVQAMFEQIDHYVVVESVRDPHALSGVDSANIRDRDGQDRRRRVDLDGGAVRNARDGSRGAAIA